MGFGGVYFENCMMWSQNRIYSQINFDYRYQVDSLPPLNSLNDYLKVKIYKQ